VRCVAQSLDVGVVNKHARCEISDWLNHGSNAYKLSQIVFVSEINLVISLERAKLSVQV